jgi:hypothetical protein
MIYEIRTYTPVKGRAAAMRARFLEHVAKEFFPKHGIELVAVFTPQDVSDERLVYVTRFSGEQTRAAAWQAFSSDADWAQIKKASEAEGPLLETQQVSILTPAMAGLVLS